MSAADTTHDRGKIKSATKTMKDSSHVPVSFENKTKCKHLPSPFKSLHDSTLLTIKPWKSLGRF